MSASTSSGERLKLSIAKAYALTRRMFNLRDEGKLWEAYAAIQTDTYPAQ
jgi:hypothetical protein